MELKRPAEHSGHDELAASAKDPAAHSLHALAEPVEMNPLAHAEHVDAPATKPVKEPAGHVEHDVSPTVDANEPNAQNSHASPFVAFTIVLTLPVAHATQVL
jgi:hypothetical protein